MVRPGADDDLRPALGAGKCYEGARNIVIDNLVERAIQMSDEVAGDRGVHG
jgi:hypothetical protein